MVTQVAILQVAHNGCLVDRSKWSCSFAELQWGPQVELSASAPLDMLPAAAQAVTKPPAGPLTGALAPILTSAPQSTVATVPDPSDQGQNTLLYSCLMALDHGDSTILDALNSIHLSVRSPYQQSLNQMLQIDDNLQKGCPVLLKLQIVLVY